MRFTIRRKLTLLTILLGLALVAASAVISSAFYMVSLKEKAEKTCREATESMSSVIEAHELEFLEGYAEKIWAVYAEYREELEQIEAGSISFETPAEREDYFSKLTEGIFPPRVGFGMSYDMVVFNNTYIRLMQDLDVIAYTNGLTRGCLWIYDAEYGNVISLMDSSSETSLLYDFPGSLVTVPDARIKTALESGTQTGFLNGEECHALCPVHDENGALTAFIYYYMNNAGISSGVRLFAVYTAAIMLAAMIIISLVIMLFADRLIAGKIRRLSSAADAFTSEIGSGKPEKVSAKITARDEIGDLSGKFDLMQDTILGYIDSLAEKTSKEEKMKTELALAARIQAEALPKDRFRKGAVVLDSFLKPAREVGGDLYDYFMLDETRLFFCLADVSGKGIPAALFMMRAKELIKGGVKAGRQLEDFVRDVNLELYSGNDECLFITAFFGVLDLKTLRLSYLRAGHEQPFLRRHESIIRIGEESNYPLGLFDDAEFSASEIMLEPADILLIFTDGLNEGINEQNEGFGYERIEDVLNTSRSDTATALFQALEAFRGSAEQFDDVTMLVLSVGDRLDLCMKNPAFEDIPRAEDAITEMLEGVDSNRVSETCIIVDELMSNSIRYAFGGTEEPEIDISLKLAANEMTLEYSDNGAPFDPLTIPEKTREEKEEDTLGGEGISLVKALADSACFERSGVWNILTIRKDMRPSEEE